MKYSCNIFNSIFECREELLFQNLGSYFIHIWMISSISSSFSLSNRSYSLTLFLYLSSSLFLFQSLEWSKFKEERDGSRRCEQEETTLMKGQLWEEAERNLLSHSHTPCLLHCLCLLSVFLKNDHFECCLIRKCLALLVFSEEAEENASHLPIHPKDLKAIDSSGLLQSNCDVDDWHEWDALRLLWHLKEKNEVRNEKWEKERKREKMKREQTIWNLFRKSQCQILFLFQVLFFKR